MCYHGIRMEGLVQAGPVERVFHDIIMNTRIPVVILKNSFIATRISGYAVAHIHPEHGNLCINLIPAGDNVIDLIGARVGCCPGSDPDYLGSAVED